MKISYNEEKLEIYGTNIKGHYFRKIRLMLAGFKLFKSVDISLNKKQKSFIIICKDKPSFEHLYSSISETFLIALNKGLMPDITIEPMCKNIELSESERKKLSKGLDRV